MRPERFCVVQASGGTYRRCSAALPLYIGSLKRITSFTFTVVKRRLTVAVGTGYRQFIVRVDSARMFTRAYLRCPVCDSQTSIRITLLGDRPALIRPCGVGVAVIPQAPERA
ncbi:hypothetical protein KCP77_24315 [Salmonella enterica subsp. enterica]|nr:hypothetical protein KCP77_24315 [Salmonella enterica subsp. enterica]